MPVVIWLPLSGELDLTGRIRVTVRELGSQGYVLRLRIQLGSGLD